MLTSHDLVSELNRRGVQFLYDDVPPVQPEPVDPVLLLASLAESDEARLRLSIIPLLLWQPELAEYAPDAVRRLRPGAQTVLKCYYTAAALLQWKYDRRLAALGVDQVPIPDRFSVELGVPATGTGNARLVALAERHAAVSGDAINWLGTYEHAAATFLAHQERLSQWKQPSTQTSFVAS